MRLLSVLVLAIVTAGWAIGVAEEPFIILPNTASDLLTRSIVKDIGNAKAAAVMMANSDSDLVSETACSPSSNQRRGRGKIRRENTCSPDGRFIASPAKGQQEFNYGQPHQMAPAEETPNDSPAAAGDGSDDPKLACNPLLVGMNRQVAVCDMGRALNRILNINIRMPTVWPIATTYPGGSYRVEDVAFWAPPGCQGSSIMWCCIETQPLSRDFLIAKLPTRPWSLVGVDCLPASGLGISEEFLGPIQPFKR